MADDIDSWRGASPVAQLRLFPCLSANVRVVLRLIEGPNPRAEAMAALELQAWRHEEQRRLMRKLFAEQLAAMREAVCDEIRMQFAEMGLGPKAQAAAAEEEEKEVGELPRGSFKDVD